MTFFGGDGEGDRDGDVTDIWTDRLFSGKYYFRFDEVELNDAKSKIVLRKAKLQDFFMCSNTNQTAFSCY